MVKGLVIDRIQKLSSGRAVLISRICRASYAIKIDSHYDPKKHKGQEVYKTYDSLLYVRDQLEWMIRKVYYLHFEAFKRADHIKGEVIDPGKPPEVRAQWDFKADTNRKQGISIYMSYNDPEDLPTYTAHGKSSFRA